MIYNNTILRGFLCGEGKLPAVQAGSFCCKTNTYQDIPAVWLLLLRWQVNEHDEPL